MSMLIKHKQSGLTIIPDEISEIGKDGSSFLCFRYFDQSPNINRLIDFKYTVEQLITSGDFEFINIEEEFSIDELYIMTNAVEHYSEICSAEICKEIMYKLRNKMEKQLEEDNNV